MPSSIGRSLPSIYYIVVDGYGSSETIKESFGVDNSDFLRFLRARGFFVARSSHSNYAHTFLSLASSLNLGYLDDVRDRVGAGSTSRAAACAMAETSLVARTLKSNGYRVVHFNSGWGCTVSSPLADETIYCGGTTELATALVHTTILAAVSNWIIRAPSDRIECQLDALRAKRDADAPMFVFAHIMAPHPPYVFVADGTRK